MRNASKFNDLLGIKYPIVQAPMILQKTLVPLAAAVSNAGGLGSLGCATKAETFDEDKLSLLIEQAPAMVSFHFGCPEPAVVGRLQGAGIVVATTATTVNEAIALERAGVCMLRGQCFSPLSRSAYHRNDGNYAFQEQLCSEADIYVVRSIGQYGRKADTSSQKERAAPEMGGPDPKFLR